VKNKRLTRKMHNTIHAGWYFFVQKADKTCEISQAGVKQN